VNGEWWMVDGEWWFKGQGQVTQNLLNTPPQEIIISTIVVFELQVGIAKSTSPAIATAKAIRTAIEIAALLRQTLRERNAKSAFAD
jgi:predicted nucleic acid-binding protein